MARRRTPRDSSRPLFDPAKMRGTPPPTPPESAGPNESSRRDTLSVTEAAALIDTTLKQGLPARLRVVGEVSGFADRTHWYFQLKDEGAVLGCVMFASAARRAGFTPGHGAEVVATGRIEHYGKQGRTQMYVEALEPVGAGALDLKFRALCEELRGLGWFDDARKQPLPTMPRRIAVVTSKRAAALQDVLDTLRRRAPFVEVLVVDVLVQGDRAAPSIAAALDWISREHERLGIDTVILTRGGGSLEDLWAFNERVVAEAVVRCAVPIIAAIGHETDTTIAELAADLRAATPTQAAVRASPDREALLELLERSGSRLIASLRRHAAHEAQRLRAAARHPFFTDPKWLLGGARATLRDTSRGIKAAARQRLTANGIRLERLSARLARRRPEAVYAARAAALADLESRLFRSLRSRLAVFDPSRAETGLVRAWGVGARLHRGRINALERELTATGPESVLRRGYTVTTTADGRIVRSVSDVRAGERLQTRVTDGAIPSVVSADSMPGASPTPRSRPARRTQPLVDKRRPQLDLFDPRDPA